MSLLLLGDSNVERVWLNVRNNRDLLRGALFVAVKRFDQLHAGFQALHPSVSIKHLLRLLWYNMTFTFELQVGSSCMYVVLCISIDYESCCHFVNLCIASWDNFRNGMRCDSLWLTHYWSLGVIFC